MADELELAGLIAGIGNNAGDEEVFAAQWKHESNGEPLSAAMYMFSNADPGTIAGGAEKIKALREAAQKYAAELTKQPPPSEASLGAHDCSRCAGALFASAGSSE